MKMEKAEGHTSGINVSPKAFLLFTLSHLPDITLLSRDRGRIWIIGSRSPHCLSFQGKHFPECTCTRVEKIAGGTWHWRKQEWSWPGCRGGRGGQDVHWVSQPLRAHPDDPAQHDFGNDGGCLCNTLAFLLSPDSKLAQAQAWPWKSGDWLPDLAITLPLDLGPWMLCELHSVNRGQENGAVAWWLELQHSCGCPEMPCPNYKLPTAKITTTGNAKTLSLGFWCLFWEELVEKWL